MTIQEFYDWCKEEDALDYELVVSSPDDTCKHRVCNKDDNICFYNLRKHVEINAWREVSKNDRR